MPFTDTNSAVDQMTAGWQSVPAASYATPQSSGGGGGDPILQSLIQTINKPLSTPSMSRTSVPQTPTSLQTPVAPHQNSPMIDTRGIVGRKQGKMAGIGNAIIGATNLVGSVVQAEAQNKQNQVKDAATKLITATQGKSEAQQALEAAQQAMKDAQPGSPEAEKAQASAKQAQAAIDQNDSAIKGVFANPKIAKSLAKGFDISYVDPASNKSPDHEAVMAAIKQAKTLQEKKDALQKAREQAGSNAAEQFQKSQAQSVQMNPFEEQQRNMELASKKVAQDTLKDYMTYKASMAGHAATITAAQLRTQAQAIQQQNTFMHQQDMLNQRIQQSNRLFEAHKNLEFALVQERAVAARQLADDVYTDKETDPLTMYTKANTTLLKYRENMSKDQNTLTSLMEERSKLYPQGAGKGAASKDPEGYQALNAQIAATQQQLKINQGMITSVQSQIDGIKAVVNTEKGGTFDGGASPNSTDGDTLPDFTDPHNFLDSNDQE